MPRTIPLTQGKVAIVDDEDYELVSGFRWSPMKKRGGQYWYATTGSNGRSGTYCAMHQLILGLRRGEFGDHINGDGLDNRRTNLRRCSRAQNSWNSRLNRRNSTGFRGVCPDGGRFRAYIDANRKRTYLGYHDTAEAAARVRDAAAIRLHGEFARLNFPKEAAPCSS